MNQKISLILEAVLDKGLYGKSFFFRCLIPILFGLAIQCFVYILVNPQLLSIYLPLFLVMILLSALPAKNIYIRAREFHPMAYSAAFVLLILSTIGEAFSFIAQFENSALGYLQFLLVFSISQFAFVTSILNIAVIGQRYSLRNNVGLKDSFFENEKNMWKSKLSGFPNLHSMLESLDEGKFIADLFDKGFFGMTVLWSCNVMEQMMNAMADGIIAKSADNRKLFRNEEGRYLPYPTQLKNLGFKHCSEGPGSISVETLWNKIRNRIAHHNYTSDFSETIQTITILISFTREMPHVLSEWASP